LELRIVSYIFVYEAVRILKKNGMSSEKTPQPTEGELEILQVLWEHGAATVRFVNDKLNEKREVGYTTTLKLLQIMVEKGLARRDTQSRTHIYEASSSEADMQQNLLQKFVDSTFRGSAMKMVLQALGNSDASREELDEIKSLIDQIEKKA
jgi:predicted transcriptional regulator